MDINQQLADDLELALNLIVDYQRQLYTLNAPDSAVARSNPLLQKYKIKPHKQSDSYRVMLETEDGGILEISDPTNIEDFGGTDKFAHDYATGRTKLVESTWEREIPEGEEDAWCQKHRVPLREDGTCHRCEFEVLETE